MLLQQYVYKMLVLQYPTALKKSNKAHAYYDANVN